LNRLRRKEYLEGGRSGSLLFCTSDKKLIIKMITQYEALVLENILAEYSNWILNNKNSKIVKIFGLFEINPGEIYCIIMENLIIDRDSMTVFDLKGSLANRKVIATDSRPNPVFKDENFIEMGIKLDSGNINIVEILKNDFLFLKTLELIDYSLIVAIKRDELEISTLVQKYTIGIIDFLQKFNLAKKSEKTLKSLFYKSADISSTDSTAYYQRITQFVDRIFFLNPI
jgi:hypothetical protein